jgi:hypothetical protein
VINASSFIQARKINGTVARAANSSWELVLLNAGDVVICEVDYFRITVTKPYSKGD